MECKRRLSSKLFENIIKMSRQFSKRDRHGKKLDANNIKLTLSVFKDYFLRRYSHLLFVSTDKTKNASFNRFNWQKTLRFFEVFMFMNFYLRGNITACARTCQPRLIVASYAFINQASIQEIYLETLKTQRFTSTVSFTGLTWCCLLFNILYCYLTSNN